MQARRDRSRSVKRPRGLSGVYQGMPPVSGTRDSRLYSAPAGSSTLLIRLTALTAMGVPGQGPIDESASAALRLSVLDARSLRRPNVRWGLYGRRSRANPKGSSASSNRLWRSSSCARSPFRPIQSTLGAPRFGKTPVSPVAKSNGRRPRTASPIAGGIASATVSGTSPRNFKVRCTASGSTRRRPTSPALRSPSISPARTSLTAPSSSTATNARMRGSPFTACRPAALSADGTIQRAFPASMRRWPGWDWVRRRWTTSRWSGAVIPGRVCRPRLHHT